MVGSLLAVEGPAASGLRALRVYQGLVKLLGPLLLLSSSHSSGLSSSLSPGPNLLGLKRAWNSCLVEPGAFKTSRALPITSGDGSQEVQMQQLVHHLLQELLNLGS